MAAQVTRTARTVLGVLGVLGGALAVVGVVVLFASGPDPEPHPRSALALLLPTPSSMTDVFPHLHVRAVKSGRAYGVTTPKELLGAHGANLGVNREWVSEPASLRLEPGQQFPDGVFSVSSAVTRFDNAEAAQAWTRQSVARVATPVHLPGAGTIAGDLVMLREPGGVPRELRYVAVFTHGDTAFSLMMIAGGSGGGDNQFVRLVQDWTRQTAASR